MGVPETESRREAQNDSAARPVHLVAIRRPFYISKTPITRGEYSECVKAQKCLITGNPGFVQTDHDPIVGVSYNDAKAYTYWLKEQTKKEYRLPGEAEWEYAARAGTPTARYWGDDFLDERNDTIIRSHNGTMPVKSHKPNQFGLYDMLGHVWQWTEDCWNDNYLHNFPDNEVPVAIGDCNRRITRGGSWNDNPPSVRSGHRGVEVISTRDTITGFRVAISY